MTRWAFRHVVLSLGGCFVLCCGIIGGCVRRYGQPQQATDPDANVFKRRGQKKIGRCRRCLLWLRGCMWKVCGGVMWLPCIFILFVLRYMNCDGGRQDRRYVGGDYNEDVVRYNEDSCYVDGKLALLFLVPVSIQCFRCFHPMVVLLLVVFLAFVVAVSTHPPTGSI